MTGGRSITVRPPEASRRGGAGWNSIRLFTQTFGLTSTWGAPTACSRRSE